MTPLNQRLARMTDGKQGVALSDEELGRYLKEHCGTSAENERRERHRVRDELYRDGGVRYMCGIVEDVFTHDQVKELRKKWVPYARFSNALKRIVGDMSTVYAEPASRSVGGSAENEQKFADLVEDVMLDEVLDHANRMLNLHRVVLLGPRVRVEEDETASLVIDVVTPANAFVVTDPIDTTKIIGVGVRTAFRTARNPWIRVPEWQLWTSTEVMYLDKDFAPLTPPAQRAHGIVNDKGKPVLPWVPLTYNAEAIPGFWPGEEGEDLVAAQVSIWMSNVLLLKETKSATKQTLITGDTTAAARNQPLDTDIPSEFPEGVTATTVDMSMDTSTFTNTSDHALERVGNNHGLSMAGLKHQGVQSAEAREVMNEPLRLIRRKQIKTFRRGERRLVLVIVAVLRRDAPELAFAVEKWREDFGEPQVLLSPSDRHDLFVKRRSAGLTSTVEHLREENTDLTEDQAWERIVKFITDETKRVGLMRELQALSGGMSEPMPEPMPADEAKPNEPDLATKAQDSTAPKPFGRNGAAAAPEPAEAQAA